MSVERLYILNIFDMLSVTLPRDFILGAPRFGCACTVPGHLLQVLSSLRYVAGFPRLSLAQKWHTPRVWVMWVYGTYRMRIVGWYRNGKKGYFEVFL